MIKFDKLCLLWIEDEGDEEIDTIPKKCKSINSKNQTLGVNPYFLT